MRARELWPDRIKRRFTLFTLHPNPEHPSEMWQRVTTVPSNKKLKKEISYLKHIGVTDIRVTVTTTHVLMDTVKGIDKISGWKPLQNNTKGETE